MKYLVKKQHAAGGFQFYASENKGSTRLSEQKQATIVNVLNDSWTEGVYQTIDGNIKRQLLNGNAQFLRKSKNGKYYFV